MVVLSHGLWARRFGEDPAVVGRNLTLSGQPYRVIGVAPAGLEDPGLSGASFAAPEIWRSPPRYFASGISRDGRSLTAIARIAPGVSLAAARSELDAVMGRLERAYPVENARWTMTAIPLEERLVGTVRQPLILLFAASGLVLLVACANVANLLLARGERRFGELAVRAMVGASRARILRQLGVESLVLSLVGAGLGLVVAEAGVRALTVVGAEQIPRWSRVDLDGTVLGFAACVALVTTLLFGLVPALRMLRTDLNAVIDRARRDGSTGAVADGLPRRTLIGAEVAVSLLLLIGSLLLLRSLATVQAVDSGLASERLLTAHLTTPAGRYNEPPAAQALYRRLVERAAALPGAESAAAINILPMGGSFDGRGFVIEGRPAPEPTVYLPQDQAPVWLWLDSTLLVRTAGDPAGLAAALREAVREIDPRIAVEDVLPMERVIGGTLDPARFRTALLAIFAALALVLGVVGLYGVVAYATAGRSRELGIRMALGARRRQVLALVMREGLGPAVAGAAVGLGAAFGLSRLLAGLLFEVDPLDPLVYVGACLLLLAAAALACFLPARRATRTDPVEALRG